MAVHESISGAYAVYLEGMEEARRSRRSVDGLLGLGGGAGSERCQDDFVAALKVAVETFAASEPSALDVCDTVSYMLSAAREHRSSDSAYWMLLASHAMAMPLIDMLTAQQARYLRESYEQDYPRRERFPVQKEVIKALKKRERI